MYPHVDNCLIHTYKLWHWLFIVSLCVPMCPGAPCGQWLIHTYKLWDWLFIVSSCGPMCPCGPMWPMVWDTGITFNAYHTLCTHVSVCAHVPPYGQYFLSIANTCVYVPMSPMCPKVRYTAITSCYCKLMCLYVPMCLPMTNGLGHSYFHLPQFAIVIAFSIMCLRSPL